MSPPPGLKIRTATHADLIDVNRVLVITWRDTYDGLIGREKVDEMTSRWHAIGVLARQVDAPGYSFLVAEVNRTIVGHALFNAEHAPVLSLARLYVLPSYQRQRIGEALLAAGIDRHPFATTLRVNVEADNAKGVSFYIRQGFVVVGERLEDGVRSLRMQKSIGRKRI
jgi:ribosomal protein S18 acetylase RimI-like enzyme